MLSCLSPGTTNGAAGSSASPPSPPAAAPPPPLLSPLLRSCLLDRLLFSSSSSATRLVSLGRGRKVDGGEFCCLLCCVGGASNYSSNRAAAQESPPTERNRKHGCSEDAAAWSTGLTLLGAFVCCRVSESEQGRPSRDPSSTEDGYTFAWTNAAANPWSRANFTSPVAAPVLTRRVQLLLPSATVSWNRAQVRAETGPRTYFRSVILTYAAAQHIIRTKSTSHTTLGGMQSRDVQRISDRLDPMRQSPPGAACQPRKNKLVSARERWRLRAAREKWLTF